MQIRTAAPGDLAALAAVEAACFPPAEAASPAALADRLAAWPGHFLLLWDGDRLAGFVNGMPTDEPDLRDEMYENAALADEAGAWQMIFGLDVAPAYRGRGLSGRLLDALKDEGWTTNAGKAFADMVAVDWGETIDRYCDMLKTLSDILTKSAGQYEDLMESELSAIRVLS